MHPSFDFSSSSSCQEKIVSTERFFASQARNNQIRPSKQKKKERVRYYPRRYRYGHHHLEAKKNGGDGGGKDELLYRADRVLANRSGKSRNECFQLLKNKRVWQVVDDSSSASSSDPALQLIDGPSTKLSMHASLKIDRVHTVPLPPPLALVYHKPTWVLSVRNDPENRPCLDETILPNLHPVGRLDYDTSGLLLFSSEGSLTQRLLHPKYDCEKEYEAVVVGIAKEQEIRDRLAAGVELKEGLFTANVLSAEPFEAEDVRPYLQSVRSELPSHYNETYLAARGYLRNFDANALTKVRLTVTEGKYRMVRRILATAGHEVVSLRRDRLGIIELGDLPVGQHRSLNNAEQAWVESVLPKKGGPKSKKKKKKKKGKIW